MVDSSTKVRGRPVSGTPGFVYFAHIQARGLVKIGWSSNVGARMRDLSSDHRSMVTLLGSYAGSYKDEAAEHARLAPYLRLRKEYFADLPEVMLRAATACTVTSTADTDNPEHVTNRVHGAPVQVAGTLNGTVQVSP